MKHALPNSTTRACRKAKCSYALGETLDLQQLDTITQEIGLAEAIGAANDLLAGQVRGRLVVDVNR
ncbi:hypothetical protein [Paraburkholderia silvatlantica]|uniref:hypothetical protein n=1 Tax=Paraburkholderia silvatlantica TaxID=321895 RepID=UPI003750815A